MYVEYMCYLANYQLPNYIKKIVCSWNDDHGIQTYNYFVINIKEVTKPNQEEFFLYFFWSHGERMGVYLGNQRAWNGFENGQLDCEGETFWYEMAFLGLHTFSLDSCRVLQRLHALKKWTS